MERYRVTARFNGSLPQRPTTFQTPSFISLPPEPNFRETPFSSYLRPETPRPSAATISRCVDDTEISIFDAERYFNEGHDAIKRTIILNAAGRCGLSTHRRDYPVDGYGRRGLTGSFWSTPTASSEARWNSQSGLLSDPPGSVRALPLKEPGKSPSSAARRLFARSCPCSSWKSVDVEEKCSVPMSPIRSSLDLNPSLTAKTLSFGTGEMGLSTIPEKATNEFGVEEMMKAKMTPRNCPKNPNFFGSSTRFSPERPCLVEIGRRMVNSGTLFGDSRGFSFPILNPSSFNLAEEPPRRSLEVFRPTKETVAALRTQPELQRRAVVFPVSGDGDRRSFTHPAIPAAPLEDDAASDASSDLFEIESFSTQTMYGRRDSGDQVRRGPEEAAPPSIAPSECYPPSEVSVQWSVTTAEGFDRASLANFSSAASDCGELRFVKAATGGAAAGGRRKSNGLLGCRSEKAVSVGPKPVRLLSAVGSERVPRAMSRAVRRR